MARPSHKELTGKLKTALQCVHANRILLVEPVVIAADAIELDYPLSELQTVLLDLLNCTGPEHYAGNRPPAKSYETRIKSLELWAFSVTCPRFTPYIYYKFALHENWFFLVSLHPSRGTRG
ncbi:hypothetical protein [Geobacter sp.]|uniref:hypothetical protein n=1 Tax=Geobacter sp. TaxID=46610 RepID=UPI001AD105B1|nr:hypothetical protein [Geobacter sp.]CAG0990506.1 hypothetical protein GEOBC_02347 [Geobacteraceae bacterium]